LFSEDFEDSEGSQTGSESENEEGIVEERRYSKKEVID